MEMPGWRSGALIIIAVAVFTRCTALKGHAPNLATPRTASAD
jgi:hypothetical protein